MGFVEWAGCVYTYINLSVVRGRRTLARYLDMGHMACFVLLRMRGSAFSNLKAQRTAGFKRSNVQVLTGGWTTCMFVKPEEVKFYVIQGKVLVEPLL
jgi:hypothetical protein